MDIICGKESGGKKSGWTGSNDSNEVFSECVLDQLNSPQKDGSRRL